MRKEFPGTGICPIGTTPLWLSTSTISPTCIARGGTTRSRAPLPGGIRFGLGRLRAGTPHHTHRLRKSGRRPIPPGSDRRVRRSPSPANGGCRCPVAGRALAGWPEPTLFWRRTATVRESRRGRGLGYGGGDQFERALGPQHNWTSFAWARIAAIKLLTDEEESGRAFLDRLHAWVAKEREERGGALSGDTKGLMDPFLLVLESVGLEAEHQRFGALLEG